MSFYFRALRHGVQRLFTLPRLSLPVILTLSLTLAAVLAVVAISSNLIFKPLPDVKDEQALYQIDRRVTVSGELTVSIFTKKRVALLAQQYQDYGDFTSFSVDDDRVTVNGTHYPVSAFSASDNILDTLGGELLLGEMPSLMNTQDAIWLSQSLWHSAYRSDPAVIGKTLHLGEAEMQIKGVVTDFQSFTPDNDEKYSQQVWRYYNLAEQIKTPTLMTISGDVRALFRETSRPITENDIEQFWHNYYRDHASELGPMESMIEAMGPVTTVRQYRDALMLEQNTMIWFLLATVIILLLMASLNLLNLFIAHYQQREQEFATQLCLGANRKKLIIMSFLENIPTFALSALLGLLGAAWIIRVLPIVSGGNLELIELVQLDMVTISIALITTLIINLFFAVLSTTQFNQQQLVSNLNSGNKGLNAGKVTVLSKVLFIAQISSAAVILTGTAMLAQSAFSTLNVTLGFTPGNTYVAEIMRHGELPELPDEEDVNEPERHKRFNAMIAVKNSVTTALHQLHHDITVLQSADEPFGFASTINMTQNPETDERLTFLAKYIAPDYINAFNIPLLAGRNITEDEYTSQARVALINEALARKLTTDGTLESVLGIKVASLQIVGIIANNYTLMSKGDGYPTLFNARHALENLNMQLVMQLPNEHGLSSEQITQVITNAHPEIKYVEVTSLNERWATEMLDERVQFYFVAGLSILTLLLAAVGSNGMAMSFTELKRFELAIRMATGATRFTLLSHTLATFKHLLFSALGIAITSACGLYFMLQKQVAMLPSFSWPALVFFTSLLITIVFFAIILVVWRIINADPMKALREQ